MTESEIRIVTALRACTFLPASWDKRFARDLYDTATYAPGHELTDRQRAWLLRLVHKYRRQIPARVLKEALDEMERAAERRVAEGKGALPDFTPRERRRVREAARTNAQAPLPLFEGLR